MNDYMIKYHGERFLELQAERKGVLVEKDDRVVAERAGLWLRSKIK